MNNYNEEFGGRLRIERARLEMNQAQLAALGGVAKLTQLKYEKGERVPSADYLYRVYQQGVDVGYLITGERAAGYVPDMQVYARNMGDKENAFASGGVNIAQLKQIIECAETRLKTSGAILSTEKKADLIAALYAISERMPLVETNDNSYAQAADIFIQSMRLDNKNR